MEYETNSHCKYLIALHLILVVKYRKKLLVGEIGEFVKDTFTRISERSEFDIEEIEIDKDHVHVLLRITPRFSVSQHVRRIKQQTNKDLWLKFPTLKRNFGLKKHFGLTGTLFALLATLPQRSSENTSKNKVSLSIHPRDIASL
jgi:putative transposase